VVRKHIVSHEANNKQRSIVISAYVAVSSLLEEVRFSLLLDSLQPKKYVGVGILVETKGMIV
jgi:hypothetical protein